MPAEGSNVAAKCSPEPWIHSGRSFGHFSRCCKSIWTPSPSNCKGRKTEWTNFGEDQAKRLEKRAGRSNRWMALRACICWQVCDIRFIQLWSVQSVWTEAIWTLSWGAWQSVYQWLGPSAYWYELWMGKFSRICIRSEKHAMLTSVLLYRYRCVLCCDGNVSWVVRAHCTSGRSNATKSQLQLESLFGSLWVTCSYVCILFLFLFLYLKDSLMLTRCSRL